MFQMKCVDPKITYTSISYHVPVIYTTNRFGKFEILYVFM
jgi:hypothetical protein